MVSESESESESEHNLPYPTYLIKLPYVYTLGYVIKKPNGNQWLTKRGLTVVMETLGTS